MIKKTFICMAIFLAGCTHVVVGKRTRQGVAFMRLPSKSLIYIDGKYHGQGRTTKRVAIPLSVGKHRVMIIDENYYPYFTTFTLNKGDLLKKYPKFYRKLDE
jgi:PEGA domain